MAYTIFVSHTRQDKKIAEQIKKIINDAFSGHIQLYLAAHELSPGTAWKDEIKRRLDSCDAIFSVISPRSLHKPWIYIEWTAFWLNDKRSYILLTENVQVADLVSPMADLQTVSVSSVEDINSLFRSLARVSDFQGAIPFDYADEFITGIRAAQRTVLQTLLEQSYGRYEYELTDLPSDNDEKQKIAEYFLESGNYETFYKVVEEITAESVKVKLVRKLIEAADILHATNVVRTINASIQLKAVGKCLFDFGYADTPLMRETIDRITNHTELRALGVHVFNAGKEDSQTFRFIVEKFTNMTELGKLGILFIENDRIVSPAFDLLVNRLSERPAPLERLAEVFINHNMEDRPQFVTVVDLLMKNSGPESRRLLSYLAQNRPQFARNLLGGNVITDRSLKTHLRKLLG